MVELLVVVLIITILAALLFPALSNALVNSRQADCMSRMRQTMVMVHLYEGEYSVILPGYMSNPNTDPWWSSMFDGMSLLVLSGIASPDVVGNHSLPDYESWVNTICRKKSPFMCPSGFTGGGTAWADMTAMQRESIDGGFEPVDYSCNGISWNPWKIVYGFAPMIAQKRRPAPDYRYDPVRNFSNPSRKIYLIEARSTNQNEAEVLTWQQQGLYSWTWYYRFPHGMAGADMERRANYTCYDGHASSYPRNWAGRGSYIFPPNMPWNF